MKKAIPLLALVLLVSLNTYADRKEVITFLQLPQAAQDAVSQHFNAADVSYVTKEYDRDIEYEVKLNNGTELEFNSDGGLKKIECKGDAVPEALLPADVVSYVKLHFPNTSIKEWSENDRECEAELSNGLELKFDKSYRFLRIGD